MMTQNLPLSALLTRIDASTTMTQINGDPLIADLTADSRHVKQGTLFAALPGRQYDGRQFIDAAVSAGAVAVLTDMTTPVPPGTAVLRAAQPRLALAQLAAAFFAPMPPYIVAVTGTNGKTSSAQFAREIFAQQGWRSASLGTLGLIAPDLPNNGSLTTPDSVTLHRTLRQCADRQITHVALEASSHGLDQCRLHALKLCAAGFTNLTRDHLDYHATMEDYLSAKLRLFTEILPFDGVAVINADAAYGPQLAAQSRGRILTYGKTGRDLRLVAQHPHMQGQDLRLEVFGQVYDVALPVMGQFQAWNALCALGMAIGAGVAPDAAVAALAQLSGVRGRVEHAGTLPHGAGVYIDYAHTPDALETVLSALRPHVGPGGRLHVVFGCGGNRDRGKRPLMGGIAQRLADHVIVTDDNPRREDPAAIRAEILAGCSSAPAVQELGDRATAIRAGINGLAAGDLLVIAGKGHEPGQIVGDQVLPFDDLDIAREILRESYK